MWLRALPAGLLVFMWAAGAAAGERTGVTVVFEELRLARASGLRAQIDTLRWTAAGAVTAANVRAQARWHGDSVRYRLQALQGRIGAPQWRFRGLHATRARDRLRAEQGRYDANTGVLHARDVVWTGTGNVVRAARGKANRDDARILLWGDVHGRVQP